VLSARRLQSTADCYRGAQREAHWKILFRRNFDTSSRRSKTSYLVILFEHKSHGRRSTDCQETRDSNAQRLHTNQIFNQINGTGKWNLAWISILRLIDWKYHISLLSLRTYRTLLKTLRKLWKNYRLFYIEFESSRKKFSIWLKNYFNKK
jgi:hypothetical protein